MTAAICIKCGAMKVGAFSPCAKCGFTPVSNEDQARSILLSDRNLDPAALKKTGYRIAEGETPAFDETAVAQMAAEFGELRKHVPPPPLGCLIFQWVLIGTMITLALALAYLYWYLRLRR